VSVVGPGGIGKTRLAQAVAHGLRGDFSDGTWLIELAPLTDAQLIVPTVGRAIVGHTPSAKEFALASLVEALRDQQLLLVLDNCEHLLGAVLELVSRIVAGAPRVRVLVTSQEPLHIPEEQVLRLAPLAVPPVTDLASALSYGAVELFVARAQGADPRFTLKADNLEAVIQICARLDGMALAIELAAARVRLLGVRGVWQRLDEQLNLLAGGGTRTAMPRHQTLRATLEWSYALLEPAVRTVFDRLGVFVGSFSLEAAQRVATDDSIDEWALLEHLGALVDKSLVLVEGEDPARYRLLESSRAFALERLEATHATAALQRRHAEAIADSLLGDETTEGPERREHRIAPDLDNVRAAVAWATGPTGDRAIAIAMAGATERLWAATGCNEEGDRIYRRVEAWVDATTCPRSAARFWRAVANLDVNTEMKRQADAALKAAEIFRTMADRLGVFTALLVAVQNFSARRETLAAESALAEARGLLDPAWPFWTQASFEFTLGFHRYHGGEETADVRTHFLATLEICRRGGGEGYLEEVAEFFLMALDYVNGDVTSAARRGNEILDYPLTPGGSWHRTWALATLGAALAALGRFEDAEAKLWSAILRCRRAIGSANLALDHVAFVLARQGRFEDAARLVGYVDAWRATQRIDPFPTQRRSHRETLAMVAPHLHPGALESLRAEGGRISEDEAIALAFPSRCAAAGRFRAQSAADDGVIRQAAREDEQEQGARRRADR
jgi:predicted ATPase